MGQEATQRGTGSSPRKASRPTRRPTRHHWKPATAYVPKLKRYATEIDVALQRLFPNEPRINQAVAKMLQGKTKDWTVRDWRRGRSRPPLWAIETLQEIGRTRVQEINEALAELEKAKSR